ncbi:hypothetical protein J5N97_011122 [Dioscorea zingiberensis]|uniref:DNA polymerase eta n=1 Tax=Dioscorea zingiberensis TaxID=325984 RepID=A0A9D5D1Q0_9LILI|nr:hypothetical protein J5N97_011122 [Dioscorea zingiberensis]
MPIPRPAPQAARVIAHVDMDCFYVQVEQRKKPELRGLPTAVVQYNAWKGGGLIAVGYEARKFGVKRSMRGDEAKEVCPDIQLIQVPVARGKADLKSYRDAGSEVVSILSAKGRCERASIDEVYLDLTDAAESMLSETPPEMLESIEKEALKSHVLGLTDDGKENEENVRRWLCQDDADHEDKLLACGAIIVSQLRIQVLEETQFTCSAGIAHNKQNLQVQCINLLSKTVVPTSCVRDLLASLPVKKMKQLGGKLGSSLQSDLGVQTVGDLLQFSVEKLQERYGTNTGSWLWNIARGISGEEVESRLLPKSHGCGKTFPGPQALKSIASVEHWLNQLCEELSERIQYDLDQNKRIAHTLTLHAGAFMYNEKELQRKFPSKSCQLRYGIAKMQEDAKKLFDSGLRDFVSPHNKRWGITSLSVSASKILDIPSGTCSISSFFQGKDCHSLSSSGSIGFNHDQSLPSPSGSHSGNKICTTPMYDMLQLRPSCEKICDGHDTSKQNKTLDVRGTSLKKRKGKEPGSILRYFQGCDFSAKQVFDGSSQMSTPLSASGQTDTLTSDSESYVDLDATEHQRRHLLCGDNDNDRIHEEQTMPTRTAWHLNVEDIDPSVIDELPLEIQREVRGWLHPPKRVQAAKHCSQITQYFSPAKNSLLTHLSCLLFLLLTTTTTTTNSIYNGSFCNKTTGFCTNTSRPTDRYNSTNASIPRTSNRNASIPVIPVTSNRNASITITSNSSSSPSSSSPNSNSIYNGGLCNKTTGFCINTSPPPGDGKKKLSVIDIVFIIIGSVVFVTLMLILVYLYLSKRNPFGLCGSNATASDPTNSNADTYVSSFKIRIFKVYQSDELRNATNCFSDDNILGQGGFGPVYKGVLHGEEIAVKKLSTEMVGREHGVRAIRSEIESLAMAKHRNLVELFGFSSDGNDQLLVYEFLENRSLDMFLFDSNKRRLLSWQTRYNIIDGVARGLGYIHLGLSTTIIHRDLKASNVLLDRNMNPKISDFGLARILGNDRTHAYTMHNAGTRGYMAPEYLSDNKYSAKSDVFSFGILVLEIVSGKRNNSYYFICEKNLPDLQSYAKKVGDEGTPLQLVDEDLNQEYNEQEALKCIKIGLLCIQENPADRPTMKDVLRILDNEF